MKTIALACLVTVIAVGHLSDCASVSQTASKSSKEVRSELITQLTKLLDGRHSSSLHKKTVDSAQARGQQLSDTQKARLESLFASLAGKIDEKTYKKSGRYEFEALIEAASRRTESCSNGDVAEVESMGYVIYPAALQDDESEGDDDSEDDDDNDDDDDGDSEDGDDTADDSDDDDDDGSDSNGDDGDSKKAKTSKVIRKPVKKSDIELKTAKKSHVKTKRSIGHAKSKKSKTKNRDDDDDTCQHAIEVSDPKIYGIAAVINDDGSTDCSNGHLKVYDGDDEDGEPVLDLCGRTAPHLFEASGNEIYVDFNHGGGDDNGGFYLFWVGGE